MQEEDIFRLPLGRELLQALGRPTNSTRDVSRVTRRKERIYHREIIKSRSRCGYSLICFQVDTPAAGGPDCFTHYTFYLPCTVYSDYLALLPPTRSDYGKFLLERQVRPPSRLYSPSFPFDSRLFYLLVAGCNVKSTGSCFRGPW